MHPTTRIREQAESLAETLDITAKEAEAYLHWYVTGDETRNKDIANWMNISPSMTSRHLQRAKQYIETSDDTDKANAFRQFLIRTDVGRGAEKKHTAIEAEFTTNTFTVITKDTITTERSPYQIHIGWRATPQDTDLIDGMPDTMTLPEEWHMTTLTGNTLTELKEHTEYYLQNTTPYHDNVPVTTFHAFKNTPVSSDWLVEQAIQTLDNTPQSA